ncbi:MAG: serine/threonine protein kinase [Planctomycetes bacterium]|nr:serine/threonine protein kinase [Planctomycetota bacterium]
MSGSDERTRKMEQTAVTAAMAGDAGASAPPAIADVAIEGEIGRGGMGVVYRGRQTYLDRPVAIKLLLIDAAAGAEYVQRFQREAKILAGLAHPHIVGCYQAGITGDGKPFLVMEYIDGPNLKQWVREHGPLPELEALRLCGDLAKALSYAHGRGIIHRDVKPENVLLARHAEAGVGAPWTAKLVDLGLARPTGGADAALTRQGTIMGTPATMAPEQFDDPDAVDHRADIYGLGCVLFHALTAKAAFSGTSLAEIIAEKVRGTPPDPRALRATIAPATASLVMAMLAKDRAERPQDYDQIVASCATLIAAGPSSGASRRRWLLHPLALFAVALIVLSIGSWVMRELGSRGEIVEAPTSEGPSVRPVIVTTAPKPPALQPSEPPAGGPATGPAEFAAATPLVRPEFTTALADWVAGPGWGVNEEAEGILGQGTGSIFRPLPSSSWRIEGVMWSFAAADSPDAFRSAGLRIELADDGSCEAAVKILAGTCYLFIKHVKSGASPVADSPLALPGTEWPFVITADRGTLAISVAGVVANPVLLTAKPRGLTLFVDHGAVGFRDLTIRTSR